MARWEYWPYYGLENYLYTTPFEAKFNMMDSTKWMQENWFHSITSSIAYVISIYVGQKLMESRKPFCLDNLLIAWNIGLALFSLLGVCRMTPELLWSVRENSFEYSICTASFAQGVTGFWTEMFALSKIAEFGDTVFIVLRKRPLLFLHWYHHVTVLVYTWHAYKVILFVDLDHFFFFFFFFFQDHTASGRWFIWMNYTVHAFMYTYYALRAMRKRLPKMAAMMVTILQILQMVGGVFIARQYVIQFQGNRYHAVITDGNGNKVQKNMIMEERLMEKNEVENDVAMKILLINFISRCIIDCIQSAGEN
ncbi:GNS1/SUR4 family protein [Onchocerca flexuosa]|uniref:Elongation of very long chain fatty acids protein n=2 Tax=Onchocerca flexuosa TaxID=387005 RepID=A0A238BZ86_9BILA|nr:GNS1/SUR4 family protein [Onchocerca flexuosa]